MCVFFFWVIFISIRVYKHKTNYEIFSSSIFKRGSFCLKDPPAQFRVHSRIIRYYSLKNVSKINSRNGEKHIPVEVIEDDAFEPRNVDHMQDFGSRLGDFQEAEEPAMDLENLKSDRFGFLRQTDSGVTEAPEEADDDEIRCIQKVMQVTYNVNSTTQCEM